MAVIRCMVQGGITGQRIVPARARATTPSSKQPSGADRRSMASDHRRSSQVSGNDAEKLPVTAFEKGVTGRPQRPCASGLSKPGRPARPRQASATSAFRHLRSSRRGGGAGHRRAYHRGPRPPGFAGQQRAGRLPAAQRLGVAGMKRPAVAAGTGPVPCPAAGCGRITSRWRAMRLTSRRPCLAIELIITGDSGQPARLRYPPARPAGRPAAVH